MPLDPNIPSAFAAEILSQFAITSTRPMLGGLSGAKVWRCQSSLLGPLCLRQWSPSHPTPQRLQFMHDALDIARQHVTFIPQLHRDRMGKSFWLNDGCLWEVTQWMPGEANYLARPNREKLWSAIDALVTLHSAWFGQLSAEEGEPAVSPTSTSLTATSPSVLQRIEMLSEWLATRDLVEQVGAAVRGPVEAAACMSTVKMLHSRGPQLLDELRHAGEQQVRLQPVLRDIWSDHLLFEGNRVSGIIDFGAMRLDEPATDLARLLGSLHPFEFDQRRAAIDYYNAQRPEHPVSAPHVDLLDRSAALLTALQWLRWLILERRKFPMNTSKLFDRWQTALSRMMGEELIIAT